MQDVFRDFAIWFAQFIVMSVSTVLAVFILLRARRKSKDIPQQNS